MDLKQMRAFIHVADQRSVSRAAAVLRITQPGLSRQIRLLEEECGTKLFHRHGHGVALTDVGAVLFEKVKRILSDVEELRSEIGERLPGTGVTGMVTLGVPTPMAWRFAGPFLDRLAEQHPGISFRIVEGFSAFLHEWLLSGTVDLAILYGPRPSTIIAATELLIEDLFAIGSPDFGHRESISVQELRGHPLIVPHPPHVLRVLAHEVGLHPSRYVEVDALSLMIELAHRGKGFSLLPLTAVRQEVLAGYVSALRIEKPALSWNVSLCRNDVKPTHAAMEVLIGHLKREVAEMVRSGLWDARLATALL